MPGVQGAAACRGERQRPSSSYAARIAWPMPCAMVFPMMLPEEARVLGTDDPLLNR